MRTIDIISMMIFFVAVVGQLGYIYFANRRQQREIADLVAFIKKYQRL